MVQEKFRIFQGISFLRRITGGVIFGLFLGSFSLLGAQGDLHRLEVLVKSAPNDRALTHSDSEWVLKQLEASSAEELAAQLDRLDAEGVEWEENVLFRAHTLFGSPDPVLSNFDKFFRLQWSLYNPSASGGTSLAGGDIDLVRALNFLEANELPKGRGLLYVIDSGVDLDQPEIEPRLVGGFNVYDPLGPPVDENGHGTHVTSIIAASKDSDGMVGVAPGPEVSVFSVKFLNANNEGDTQRAIEAIAAARAHFEAYKRDVDPEARAIFNMSFGSPRYSQAFRDALQSVSGPDVVFVASAGNSGSDNDITPQWPCNYNVPNLICVSASDRSDRIASFSNYGRTTVHLLAPGVNIFGAVIGEFLGSQYSANYLDKSGTSQAAPHVAGAALLVWGVKPEASATEVKAIILNSVDRIPLGHRDVASSGRLNAYRAVLLASGADPSMADRSFFTELESSGGGGCQVRLGSHQNTSTVWVLLSFLALGLLLTRKQALARKEM